MFSLCWLKMEKRILTQTTFEIEKKREKKRNEQRRKKESAHIHKTCSQAACSIDYYDDGVRVACHTNVDDRKMFHVLFQN